ncbi:MULTISPECIES: CoA-transferase subunit beta [Desulfococcus]|uniref:Coenzyme A transferase n=1 Tax=Desulfococcus multivorans DSM 2059 TaxID=1121405 RepID=S7VJZ1_DESML|nr:CoA-transferase [Desulfococcus multivorans]AOY59060.1 GctB: glutaconate CoA-transferase subunit B [Desulfococcus multivorans]AQV01311.1 ketoacid-CoA transferase [Desulfococcus multivorans]EPR44873.1 coenzyme A transferase [Desulfococcus multivorans DSM 2059]SJZ82295.1 glutaconate CoA-transferase subunit B [Desulfococcus multivorans DSM 2059]
MEKLCYTPREMMTIMAAREIGDGDIVFCGTGISMLAAVAAKKINAPNSVIFFETGAVDARIAELPLAVSDPRIMYGAAAHGNLLDAFAFMQNRFTGDRIIAILGAAQIDPFGNLNTTCIGPYDRPVIRFSGSGGGCDVASFVPRCIAFMQHEKRKFVERIDYLTSPGGLDGGRSREKAGLRPGGIGVVITNKAVMRIDPETRRLYLDRYYPGIAPREIQDSTGFAVDVSRSCEASPPTATELRILREVCDPQGLILRNRPSD